MRFAVLALAALFLEGSAFRVKPKRRTKRTPGQVHGLFSYGSPGISKPALQNARGGPCFPGVRFANVKKQWFGQEADTAATITGVIGFKHPLVDFQLVDLKTPRNNKLYSCASEGTEVGNRPRGLSKINLHDRGLYAAATEHMDHGFGDLLHTLSNLAVPHSYNHDLNSAHAAAQALGWGRIGSAVDTGGIWQAGLSISHLFQKTPSKECILTFQGSSSTKDWIANVNIRTVSFCGLAPANAAETDTLAAGEALVHKGFKDALMHMVNNTDWQTTVRPKLSSCSKVYVTGHSQGGVEAELFAACAQRAPAEGENGWDDYKYIGWYER